jgi:hypothetical protein
LSLNGWNFFLQLPLHVSLPIIVAMIIKCCLIWSWVWLPILSIGLEVGKISVLVVIFTSCHSNGSTIMATLDSRNSKALFSDHERTCFPLPSVESLMGIYSCSGTSAIKCSEAKFFVSPPKIFINIPSSFRSSSWIQKQNLCNGATLLPRHTWYCLLCVIFFAVAVFIPRYQACLWQGSSAGT